MIFIIVERSKIFDRINTKLLINKVHHIHMVQSNYNAVNNHKHTSVLKCLTHYLPESMKLTKSQAHCMIPCIILKN